METPLLVRHEGCTQCPLSKDCKSVGIGAVPYGPPKFLGQRALLVVGDAPGYTDDDEGAPFMGKPGDLLRRGYVGAWHFADYADVYLTYAVRCLPPGLKTPKDAVIKACHNHLLADVRALRAHYNEVIILCVGAVASKSVTNLSQSKGFSANGNFSNFPLLRDAFAAKQPKSSAKTKPRGIVYQEWLAASSILSTADYPEPTRVFHTYHPNYLGRNRSAAYSVNRHLRLLYDYLTGVPSAHTEPLSVADIEAACAPPAEFPARFTLDIESYGIIKGQQQDYFHPLKSTLWDRVPRGRQVVSVVITYRRADGRLRHVRFLPGVRDDYRFLEQWLAAASASASWLLGQNIVFDITMLRYNYPGLRRFLCRPLHLMDLMVTSFLMDENMPEKGLKPMSRLWRIDDYDQSEHGFIQYDGPNDPSLWLYNAKDTQNTTILQEKFETIIKDMYGPNTRKGTEYCWTWYSDLLWLVVHLTESGFCVNRPMCVALRERLERTESKLQAFFEARGYKLTGKGCDTNRRRLIADALAAVDLDPADEGAAELVTMIERTDETKLLRHSETNRNILKALLPKSHPMRKLLCVYDQLTTISGTLDRYLYPMLEGQLYKKKMRYGSCIDRDNLVYSKWYPFPTQYEGDLKPGGTVQTRFSAKGPAIQTFPPPIKACCVSRHNPGFLLWWDFKQIEILVAALLSNDAAMFASVLNDTDLHSETATLLFGQATKKYRQAGKTLNFLSLFKGGAKKFRNSLMIMLGIFLEESQAYSFLDKFWAKHSGLGKFQENLIATAKAKGFVELPLIGQSRLFLSDRNGKGLPINVIVNLPVQSIAACITISAQVEIQKRLEAAGMLSCTPANIHDALAIDGPLHEYGRVRAIVEDVVRNPPFYQDLVAHLGRSLPLRGEFDVKFFKKSVDTGLPVCYNSAVSKFPVV